MKHQCLVVLIALACTLSALAADKVAYLNMEKVFEGYYKTLQENYQFELQKQDFEDRLQLMQEEFQNSLKEAQKADADSKNELLSQSAREESKRKVGMMMERLQAKREELMKFRQEGYQKLQSTRGVTEEGLIKDLTDQVEKFAQDKGYTHVYEVSGRSLNRVPFLMVYPKDQEITEDVVLLINRGHEKELQESKEKTEALKKKNADRSKAAGEAQLP
ncbi:MAG: OmpH family outer membrane protein [Oligosphaeraceae bacterium]|nr:OmpH family outer membrane protein [Oligosphaeraceae bacterium]